MSGKKRLFFKFNKLFLFLIIILLICRQPFFPLVWADDQATPAPQQVNPSPSQVNEEASSSSEKDSNNPDAETTPTPIIETNSPSPLFSVPASSSASFSASPATASSSPATYLIKSSSEASQEASFSNEASSASFLRKFFLNPVKGLVKLLIKGKKPSLTKHNFQAQEKVSVNLGNYHPEEVVISLIFQGKEVPSHHQTKNDSLEINPPRAFRPGPYHLNIKDRETGKTLLDQDFTWGVLAINTNKSVYLPQETAKLAFAVLDEQGKMVCDAQLRLKIKNKKLKIDEELSTENGQIKATKQCPLHDFSLQPDYEAEYQVQGAGVYEMELTAETKNGRYKINDSFMVKDEVPFEVERISATRLYPPRTYPVLLKIQPHEDFQGEVVESVPKNFQIIAPHSETALPFRVEENDQEKLLIWSVNWQKGDVQQLEYYFRSPQISPQFYLLGPLKFRHTIQKIDHPQEIPTEKNATASNQINPATQTIDSPLLDASPPGAAKESANVITTEKAIVFQEARFWQIAADDTTGAKTAGTASSSDWTGWTTTNLNASDDNKATYSLVGSATGTLSGFAFNVPTSATSIDGIVVQIEGRESNTTCNGYFETSLSWDDGTSYTSAYRSPDTGELATSDTVYSEGGSTDTWGHTWTVDEINNHFQVKIVGTNEKSGKNIEIDQVTVTVYYTVPVTDSWTGTVYTDDDESQTIADGTSVCAVVNSGTPACTTTSNGVFTINTLDAAAGDQLTFFIDGGSIFANTVTISDGGDIVGADNLRLYQNHVVLRHEQGTSITILDMDAYDNDQNATDMLYDAEDLATDTLDVESNIELFVYNGYTFTPGGTVTTTGTGNLQLDTNATFNGGTTFDDTIAGDLIIGSGATFNAPSTANDGTLTINGNFTNNGTFNAGSGEVIFAGADSSTQALTGSTTFYDFTASTNANASGRTLQFAGNSTTTVSGTWTITGYSGKVITLQSSDTNNWTINPSAASVTYVDVYRSTNTGVSFCATYSTKDANTIGWDVSSGSSCNQAPNDPTSLTQKKTDDTVLAVGDWTNETSVKFTATATDPDSSDTLYLCVEKDLLGTDFSGTEDLCGTGVAYSGTAVTVTVTITGIADASQYHWQARIKDAAGAYSSWVSYETNLETERDFGVDTTPPSGGTVYDGTEAGVDKEFNNGSLSSLSANWSGFDASVSGLDHYEYSIGTTAGGTDIQGWTNVGLGTSATATGLTLQTSSPYYFNVRAVDKAGNTQSPAVSSDGQLVAPSLTFGIDPTSISFTNLNAANNYEDSKTVTLTTSTNAYNGYVIRAFVSDYLRSLDNNFTIGDFNGGTYASPDEWLSSDRGFGYHSSDTSIQGSDIFNNSPCPGGGNPPCFAPFSHTGPGDIIADHTANVSGSPISNEQFTITLKVKTDSNQEASTYSTNIIYTITAHY